MAAVPKKKSRSCGTPAAHAASCRTSKVPGEDWVCFLCHDGGTLVMCDRRHCPKAYHPACVGRTMQFFKTKGAWLCARHFCSKCSKQPCTYCIMCPNSFCSKCVSCMPTEAYLPLSEEEGLCKTCMSLAKMIELQETIEGKTVVNFEDSETAEFLFKEYWLLLKRFHGYNLTNSAPSCTGDLPPSGSCDNVVPPMSVDSKIRSDPQTPSCNIATATTPNTRTLGLMKPSPTNESISAPKNFKQVVSIKRRSTSTGSVLRAKKKIRVLKLLNDSSSGEDDDENKPSSRMVCSGKQKIENSISSESALPINKPVSSEITGAPSFSVEAILESSVNGTAKPLSVNYISSTPKALLYMIDDSSQPLLVAPNTTSHPEPIIHRVAADACKSPANYSKLFKKPHSNKVSANSPSETNRVQSLYPACDGLVSAKELSESALPKPRPAAFASTSKPLPMEKPSALPAAKTPPKPSNVSCKPKPLLIKPLSFATPAPDKHSQQLLQDTSKDMPSSNSASASPDFKKPSLKAKSVLPLKRPHGRSHAQESCKNVDATSSTCDKAEALAPITVQNVSRIYLRRSRLEELLSDQRFTLLILGAFVRIRHSKQGNNYRLVQIAGTATLQAHYYQVGEKKTNVVLEVLNLNKRQRIKIDHVSNNMFTGEECERLQQSVELGFINAPTMRALEEKAAALQKVKANQCLDEKLAKLASKVQSKEADLNKESREKGVKIPLSPDHLVKFYTQTQIDGGEQVQADKVPVCVESTTTKAEKESELFEAKIETALADNNGVGKQTALAFNREKRHNDCPNCGIDEYQKREIQKKAEDGHIVLNEEQVAAGKQADADQHSDISVEMTTVFAETGQSNMHSPGILTTLASQNCTEDEAELILPKKSQKKRSQDSGLNKNLMKEHWPSLMTENINQAQGDGPVEVFVRKHMDVGPHRDVGVDLATNINEDKMNAAKLATTSAVYPRTKDVTTSNLAQGIPLTESQEYGIIQDPTDKPHSGMTFQIENEGCAQEYIRTIVGSNDSDKRAVDLMPWFYQDMKEKTFGPFSLEQLRKWSRTEVFPPDLKIWRTVKGQKFSILLVDALNAQEIKVLGMATENSIAVESCLDPLKQKGMVFTESGSTCHTVSKGLFGDGGMPTSRTDWQSTSAHAGQSFDSSVNLGDWSAPVEQAELKLRILWNSPHSTQFSIEDVSVKRGQGETYSDFEHPVSNEECEKALNIQTQMNTDSCWKLHTSATETSVEGEIQHKSNRKDIEGKSKPAHTKSKETSAEGERGVQSSPAHTFRKRICVVEEIQGKFSPVCTEGKSSPTHTEKETLAASDDGWSLSEIGKLNSGTPHLSQFDVLKERVASVQGSQCETPYNCEILAINNKPEMAMHPSEQRRGAIADAGLNFQSLAEETSSNGKREGKSVSPRQDTLTIDEGWTSPGKWDFELETWANQYDALRKEEESINRCRDEILSNLIDAVSTKECMKGTFAENDCYTLTEDPSAYGNNINCNTEQRLEKLATLDDGWGSPGELEQGTGWGSPNSTWFNKSEQKISMVQSCHDKRSSKKLQSDEREIIQAGGVHDGAQKNVDSYLSERGEGWSLSHDIHSEKDQRWTHTPQGHGRTRTVKDADCNISSRGRDTSLSEKSGCQRDFGHLKSSGGRTTAESDCYTSTGGTSAYGNNISCDTEKRVEKLATLDDGWGSPGELEQGTGWGSPNSTWFNKSEQKISMVQSCHNKRSSKKLQSKDERQITQAGSVHDGAQNNVDCYLSERGEGRSLFHDIHPEKDQRWTHSSQGHGRAWRLQDSDCNISSRGRDTFLSEKSDFSRGQTRKYEDLAGYGKGTERESKRSHLWESIVCQKQDKFRSDQRCFAIEGNTSPKPTGREESAFMRSHSREPHKQDRCRRDQKSFSQESKVLSENGKETAEEVRISHSRNGWKSISKERKASPENAGNREVRKSHTRNDIRSISREQKASPESAGQRTEKKSKRSHSQKDWRSISRDRKASPEYAGNRERKRSCSRNDRRSISRERKVYSETAGEREVRRSCSGNDRRPAVRDHKASPGSAGEKGVRRSCSGNDRRPALREHKASPESAGNRTEKEVRKSSHSRNDWRSFSKELEASPETAGKITEKEVRGSQARNYQRSLSKEPKASPRNAGRRKEEEDWKTHSRDDVRSIPREQRTSPIPKSSSYRSLSGRGDDALRSRSFSRELRDSSACASSSAHRSLPISLVDGVHRGASRKGRWERNNNTAQKYSGLSPCQELILRSGQIFCPKESIVQPTQTNDQGWTPPDSPLNYPARCWSSGVAGRVEKFDDGFVLSGILSKSEAPPSPKEHVLHPGSPELVLSDSYPPPPLPISASPNHMSPPPPPPLPAETSHICHIDQYATWAIVK